MFPNTLPPAIAEPKRNPVHLCPLRFVDIKPSLGLEAVRVCTVYSWIAGCVELGDGDARACWEVDAPDLCSWWSDGALYAVGVDEQPPGGHGC